MPKGRRWTRRLSEFVRLEDFTPRPLVPEERSSGRAVERSAARLTARFLGSQRESRPLCLAVGGWLACMSPEEPEVPTSCHETSKGADPGITTYIEFPPRQRTIASFGAPSSHNLHPLQACVARRQAVCPSAPARSRGRRNGPAPICNGPALFRHASFLVPRRSRSRLWLLLALVSWEGTRSVGMFGREPLFIRSHHTHPLPRGSKP